MLRRATFFRWIAVPACIAWGLREFMALQRVRLAHRGDAKLSQ